MDSFLYCSIYRESVMLVDYCNSGVPSNSLLLALESIIKHLGSQAITEKRIDGFIYHIVSFNGFEFCVVAKETVNRTTIINFLDELRRNFFANSSVVNQSKTCKTNGLEVAYGETLRGLMRRWFTNESDGSAPQRMDELREQINEVREIMTANVERVLARGERLEDLLDKSTDLESSSSQFRSHAQQLQRKMCCKNAKWTIISIAFALIVFTTVIIVILYEANVFGGSSSAPTPPPHHP